MHRAQFRWHLKHEIALLSELAANKPTTGKDWQNTWKKVSEGIKQVGIFTTPRSCRDHFTNAMLTKFDKDNKESLKRSGVAEDYDEFWQLMTDLSEYIRDLPSGLAEKKKPYIQDGEKAKQLGEAAMLSLKRKKCLDKTLPLEDSDSDESTSSISTSALVCKAKKTRGTRGDMIQFLEKKRERSMEYKKDAFEVEKRRVTAMEEQLGVMNNILMALMKKSEQ